LLRRHIDSGLFLTFKKFMSLTMLKFEI
jgi:hypothetical protein